MTFDPDKHEEVDGFTLVEILNRRISKADLFCDGCKTSWAVVMEVSHLKKWPAYLHPRIDDLEKHELDFIQLNPKLIKAVLSTYKKIICPKCEEPRIRLHSFSKFQPNVILRSLRVNENSTAKNS